MASPHSIMSHKSAQILVITVLFLVALGITMLCSTSVFGAHASADDAYYDVKRQFMWIVGGCIACSVLAVIDYDFWRRTAWVWYGLAIVALALCFVPHIGMEINGEKRWVSAKAVGLSALRCQPSELGKLALVIVLAKWYERYQSEGKTFYRGFFLPISIGAVLILLVLFEVDIGTAMILGAAAFAMMFLAGANWKYLAVTGIAGAAALAGLIYSIPNRRERVAGLFDPEAYGQTSMLQQNLSLLAFGSGGLDGLGLGNGRLKMLYMPFAHTDFIFPMVGEELGLVFTLAVVLSFVIIVVFGMLIAMHAPDSFGKLLAFGIVLCIAIQAILNIGVTTAVLPNTGLPLPFVSYGGSNIVFCLVGVGILINIFRQGNQSEAARAPLIRKPKATPGAGRI